MPHKYRTFFGMDSIWHPYLCSKLSGLKFQYNQQLLRFERYPEGDQQGLRAWSAADELMLDSVKDRDLTEKEILLYNDRFGFLATCFKRVSANPDYHQQKPRESSPSKSQAQ